MLLSRIIFVSISALFSCYCVFIALFTVLGKNVATYHLQRIYLLGFVAVYAILTPFGIAGIIGGLNRKKALIKGFMMQYWIATIAFVGLSIGLITMAGSSKRDTFIKCRGEFPPDSVEDVRQICVNRVLEFESITKIASYVQGGVLVFFGILVTFFGIREFKDIKMDEETSGLLDKAAFNSKEEIDSSTSSTSDHSQLLPPGSALNRNPSNASSAYSNTSSSSNGSINRYPPMTPYSGTPGRNFTNASTLSSPYQVPSNYPLPNATNLSRNPTNASNYTTITTASSTSSSSSNRHYPPSSNNYHNVNRVPIGGGISRYPTNASNYSSVSSNSNRSNYSNYSNNNNISRRNYNGTPPPQVPPPPPSLHHQHQYHQHHQYHQPPPPSSSRPLQQYSTISNKPSHQYNNNNPPPPLIINDESIIEEEEGDYDDYNNYNYENNNNQR